MLLNDDGSQENTGRLSQRHIKQVQVMGVAGLRKEYFVTDIV